MNSNYGRYGYGWGAALSRLSFDIPRPVAELPIEAHLRINRASANVEGGPEGSSDAYINVSLWLTQDPRCGCDRDYLLAEKSVLWVSRGSAQTITDQEIVLTASLLGYEDLPAGTYGVEVRTGANAHTDYPGHEAWASFDVTLLKLSVAGHRSFVGRRAR